MNTAGSVRTVKATADTIGDVLPRTTTKPRTVKGGGDRQQHQAERQPEQGGVDRHAR